MKQRDTVRMSDDEIAEFLGRRNSMTMCTINHDGSIHAVAMWYGFLGDAIAHPTRYIDRDEKGRELVERVRESGAEGVVVCAASFCDPALLDQPMAVAAVEKAGIPWTAFALFWMAGASGLLFGGFGGGNGPPGMGAFFICFPLFGIPFVLIGLGMLTSPFWAVRRAKRTCYALTDRRAILWEAGWFGRIEVRSYGPADLTRLRRVEYADGNGDLVFEEIITFDREFDRIPHLQRTEP